MAWVTPTNVATGDVLTAAKWNQDVVDNSISLPRGLIIRKSRTSNQTGIVSAESDVLADSGSLSVTWTADPTRLYRTTFYCPYAEQQTTASYPIVKITDGSNVMKQSVDMYQAPSGGMPVHMVVIESGLSGSTTRKGRARTAAGSLTLVGGSDRPMFIAVEDIGAA
jgi:hypothetical protein